MVGAQVATESDTAIDAFVGRVDVVDDQRTVRAVHLVPAATTPSVTVPTNTHWQAQRPLTAGPGSAARFGTLPAPVPLSVSLNIGQGCNPQFLDWAVDTTDPGS